MGWSDYAGGGGVLHDGSNSFYSYSGGSGSGSIPQPFSGPGPSPFLLSLPAGQQPFLGGGLVDVTQIAHQRPQPVDLLSGDQYFFSTLPYTTAPHFPLPTMTSLSSEGFGGADFDYGLGPTDSRFYAQNHSAVAAGSGSGAGGVGVASMLATQLEHDEESGAHRGHRIDDYYFGVDPLEMPTISLAPSHDRTHSTGTSRNNNGSSSRVTGRGSKDHPNTKERDKGRAATASAAKNSAENSEKPAFQQGYLGGLDLSKKISGFGKTYGGKVDKLVLGQRHDGRPQPGGR